MSLEDQLGNAIKEAMRGREAERLATLRLLKSAISYALIEKKADALSDADFIGVVQREVKKRRDAAAQYDQGGRPELAEKERKEIEVLEEFLPPALSPDELDRLVQEVIRETGATSRKEMGAVIKAVQGKAPGRAEGRAISEAVARRLPG